MAKKTRLEELQDECFNKGCFVRTWSPGDGVTRYRFFDVERSNSSKQSYFGPDNGIYTALGLKEAWSFLAGRSERTTKPCLRCDNRVPVARVVSLCDRCLKKSRKHRYGA